MWYSVDREAKQKGLVLCILFLRVGLVGGLEMFHDTITFLSFFSTLIPTLFHVVFISFLLSVSSPLWFPAFQWRVEKNYRMFLPNSYVGGRRGGRRLSLSTYTSSSPRLFRSARRPACHHITPQSALPISPYYLSTSHAPGLCKKTIGTVIPSNLGQSA
ncbi:hypothetical protein F4775DRAFT_5488 [Biscogniauxia sp. FL1348]|nr:hypothetical protein F4775DRAFT_5488 [Biscogniauxia sp. FL1348]